MLTADGDRPLEPRREDFCRRRARGESQAKAYVGAGYKAGPNGAAGRLGWRLEQRPNIKARIAALKAIVGDAKLPVVLGNGFARPSVSVNKEYVLDGLVEIAERCMQHHVLTDMQGAPIKVPGPDGQMCLLVGFRPKEATRAYELLGKELGMFVERLDATHRFEERYRTMTQAERMADAEALADEVRRLLGRQEQERIEAEATDAEAIELIDEAPAEETQDDEPAEVAELVDDDAAEPVAKPKRGRGWRSRQLAAKRERKAATAPSKQPGLGSLGLGVPDPRPNGGSYGGTDPDSQGQAPYTKDESA